MKSTGGNVAKKEMVKKDNEEQSRRLVETAKELEATKSGETFEKAMNAIANQVRQDEDEPKSKKL